MKKIFCLLFALPALLLVASCTPEVDDAFDKPSAERIAEAIKNTKEVLVAAPNGWRMDYQGSGGFGGYNILCKFGADNSVSCEEETQNVKSTSHYTVLQGQGVLLSFDSFNAALHKYSDPVGNLNGKAVGKNGKGFLGDFEFRVMSCTKDSVVLEGRKHGDRVVMTPMPENLTWDSYFSQLSSVIQAMYAENYNIIIGNDTFPLNGKKLTTFVYSSDDKWLDENDKTIQLQPRPTTPLEAFFANDWTINVGYSRTAEMNIWKTAADYALSQNMKIFTVYFSTQPGFLSLAEYVGNAWGDIRTVYSVSGTDQLTISGFKINKKGTAGEKNGAVFYNKYKMDEIAKTFLVNGAPTTYTLTTNNPKNPTMLRMTCNSDDNISFVFDRGVWRVDF